MTTHAATFHFNLTEASVTEKENGDMAAGTVTREHRLLDLRRQEQLEYRLISIACFPLFLVIAIFSRLLPRSWRPFPGVKGKRRSVFGEARAAVNTIIPFAFMR